MQLEEKQGVPFLVGYGFTAEEALRDLFGKIDQRVADAQAQATSVVAAMVRVRGELEALTDD